MPTNAVHADLFCPRRQAGCPRLCTTVHAARNLLEVRCVHIRSYAEEDREARDARGRQLRVSERDNRSEQRRSFAVLLGEPGSEFEDFPGLVAAFERAHSPLVLTWVKY